MGGNWESMILLLEIQVVHRWVYRAGCPPNSGVNFPLVQQRNLYVKLGSLCPYCNPCARVEQGLYISLKSRKTMKSPHISGSLQRVQSQ